MSHTIRIVKALALGLGCSALAVAPQSLTAAPKKGGRAHPASRKISDTELLAGQLAINQAKPGESVGAVCNRSSFKFLAVALKANADWLAAPKGEFETSEAYAARKQKLEGLLSDNPVVICESLNDNEDVSFAYDADHKQFDGSFLRSHNVWRDIKSLGSYRSKTRMGISATVKSSIEFEYDVSLQFPDEMQGCLSGTYSVAFHAPTPIENAPALKRYGRIVYLAKLVSPFVETSQSPGSPTIDDPHDIYTSTLTVHAKPLKVIVIDGRDAEVWSCTPGRFVPSQLPSPKGSAGYWINSNDYPSRALREGKSGVVSFEITVDADGQASDCRVTASSGTPELDDATCSNLQRRARFNPATDAEGNPIKGIYRSKMNWVLPVD